MENIYLYVSVFSLLSLIVSASITYIMTKKFLSESIYKNIEAEFNKRIIQLQKDAVEEHVSGEGYMAILENAYIRGKEEGAKQEKSKFVFEYTPFLVECDGFFKKSADIGYDTQMYYDGMPIGSEMRKITRHVENFKDETAKNLIAEVANAVNKIAELLSGNGIGHVLKNFDQQGKINEK